MRDLVTERRTRIGRRHRLAAETRATHPAQAAAAVVALHGTDATSVFLSAWARMQDGDVAGLERALYEERSLVRVLAMRRTMFVAPVGTAGVLLAAASRDVAATERRRLLALVAEHGDDAWLSGAEEAALRALEELGEATASELAATDPRLATVLTISPGTGYEARQKLAGRVLTVLGAQGRAVRARPRGSWTSAQFHWAPLGRWQPEVDTGLEREAARTELARRYLRVFGPATVEDLRWWTGWPLGATRAALGGLDLEETDAGLVLAGDTAPEPPVAPWAALLPALDPTTMGWRGRDWYLGGHGPLLFDRNGNAGPTVWVDGRVVGGWVQAPGGEIRWRLLEDIGAEAQALIEQEAAALAERVGPAKLSPRARGRSPVEKGLLE